VKPVGLDLPDDFLEDEQKGDVEVPDIGGIVK